MDTTDVAFDITNEDGSVMTWMLPMDRTEFRMGMSAFVDLARFDQLTNMTGINLFLCRFPKIPTCVFAMTQLTSLGFPGNRITSIPPEIGHLRSLKEIHVNGNGIVSLPREFCQLRALERAFLGNNLLTSLPVELGHLPLKVLSVVRNRLTWVPLSLDRLPATTEISLEENPLPIDVGPADSVTDSRHKLPELFAATTVFAMIRDEATTLAVGLQDLELPALVTLEIIDAAFPNSISMHLKWNLITAVKHFRERH